jgi:steroid delta-isomerase-like uncharacterized protein
VGHSVVGTGIGGASPTQERDMSEATRTHEQLVRAYAALWNEQDYAGIPDVVSESYVHTGPVGEVHGHDGLEGLMREFTAAFPDFHVEVVDVIVDEDGETAVAEGRYTMTHEGTFDGIEPTHRSVEVSALAKLGIEDGRIDEHREFHNQLEILEQLGVVEF